MIGNTVYLNSGGPAMRVVDRYAAPEEMIVVEWADARGEHQRATLPAACCTDEEPEWE